LDEAAVGRLFAGIQLLEILANNAGIGPVGNLQETGLADFQRLFRVN
jgi:NAD(P)-dependent dehydrogenase (short-subunit alcohol dehydrogenase family)